MATGEFSLRTRSGRSYGGQFRIPEAPAPEMLLPRSIRTGRSFISEIQAALDIEGDDGAYSPSLSPTASRPSTPDGLEVPRASSPAVDATPPRPPSALPFHIALLDALDQLETMPSIAYAQSEGCSSGLGSASECVESEYFVDSPCAATSSLSIRATTKAQHEARAKRKREGEKRRRSAKRQRCAASRRPTDQRVPVFNNQPIALPATLKPDVDLPTTSTGYTGARAKSIKPFKVWTLAQLREDGQDIYAWDGVTPVAIIDDEGRIVAVLAGRPVAKADKPDDWDEVIAGLEAAIDKLKRSVKFRKGDKGHRRGGHSAQAFGVSHGGGQKHPSVLRQLNKTSQEAYDTFRQDKYVRRVAGFGSSAFSCFAPKLYSRYCDYFTRLCENDHGLLWNFENSVFPAATVNFGPSAVCYDHLDFANAAAGWCAITSAGNYNPKLGGHLFLYDVKLVIEFPPGSTILIPSSIMRHGNTPIGKNETRMGITQYAAGALFRWVDNGFMKAESTSEKHKAFMAADAPKRFRTLLDLYSTLGSLASDRASVYSK